MECGLKKNDKVQIFRQPEQVYWIKTRLTSREKDMTVNKGRIEMETVWHVKEMEKS